MWSDKRLVKWGISGGITPFNREHANPVSVDLTLDLYYRYPTETGWSGLQEIPEKGLVVYPNELFLLSTAEKTIIPPIASALIFLKSSKARMGWEHLHAGLGEPGFDGQWTLEVINHWPYPQRLYAGERFVQICLFDCGDVAKNYKETGHYQNQKHATIPWQWEE